MFKAADDRQTPAPAHLHSVDLLCIDVTHTVWHQRCALCEIIRFHTYWKDEEWGVARGQTCMQLMCYIAVYSKPKFLVWQLSRGLEWPLV